jgi:pilus assembly protein Flp/PilA
MTKLIQRFLRDEEGQDLAEYALLLGLIAVVVAAAVTTLQQAISPQFTGAAGVLNQ